MIRVHVVRLVRAPSESEEISQSRSQKDVNERQPPEEVTEASGTAVRDVTSVPSSGESDDCPRVECGSGPVDEGVGVPREEAISEVGDPDESHTENREAPSLSNVNNQEQSNNVDSDATRKWVPA